MTYAKRFLVGFAGSISLVLMILAALLQLARPDLLHVALGGAFGSARSAILWLYLVGFGIAAVTMLSARRPWSRFRKLLGVFAVAAAVLLIVHLATFARGYTIATVAYSSEDGTPLEASLYLPRAAGPHPAAVIVHGSAPLRRGAYEVLVEPLVENGYAVLLADKRGVGGSGGTFDTQDNVGTANIELLTSDVLAGVRFLSTHDAIRHDRIGLFGISQAGWVAPLAAERDTMVRFLVMITAPTVSSREENAWSELRGDHTGDTATALGVAEQILDTLSSGGVDARQSLSKLTIPGLWLFGSDDNSIPGKKSMRVLDSLNATGGRYSYRLYEGYGHALLGRNGAVVPRLAPAFRGDIVKWLRSLP